MIKLKNQSFSIFKILCKKIINTDKNELDVAKNCSSDIKHTIPVPIFTSGSVVLRTWIEPSPLPSKSPREFLWAKQEKVGSPFLISYGVSINLGWFGIGLILISEHDRKIWVIPRI